MYRRLVSATLALLVLVLAPLPSSAAERFVLAGGPIYGDMDAASGTFFCRIFNAGTSSVTINSVKMFDHTGAARPLGFNNCTTPVDPAKSCNVTTGAGNFPVSCRVIYQATAASLVGSVELISSTDHHVISLPLQNVPQ